jgi:oligopeptide/dipeptide ABC transporter ATP-binding protein
MVVMYAGESSSRRRSPRSSRDRSTPTRSACSAPAAAQCAAGAARHHRGTVPNLAAPPPGCRFAPRCPFVEDRCRRDQPPLRELGPGHRAACLARPRSVRAGPAAKPSPLLRVRNPSRTSRCATAARAAGRCGRGGRRHLLRPRRRRDPRHRRRERLRSRPPGACAAPDRPTSTVGSRARTSRAERHEMRARRPHADLQDPYASLNPRMTVGGFSRAGAAARLRARHRVVSASRAAPARRPQPLPRNAPRILLGSASASARALACNR